jgi:DNA-directed RNA polymerase specialized sigma24 family protein
VRLVSRSRALDVLRSRKRNPWQGEPMDHDALEIVAEPESATQSPRLLAREQLLALRDHIEARFNARDQHLFFALFVEDSRPADVAAELGMTADAVYQWASRFRRRVLPGLVQAVTGEMTAELGPRQGVKAAPAAP